MRAIFLALVALSVGAVAIIGGAEQAFLLAMVMAMAELGCLCAPEMYFISAASEIDDRQRARLGNTAAWMVFGSAAAVALLVWLAGASVEWIAVGAVYAMLRVQFERARVICRRFVPVVIGAGTLLLPFAAQVLPWDFARAFAVGGLALIVVAELLIRLNLLPGSDFVWPGIRPTAALFRALPEALASRALYLIPAGALCLAAWYAWRVNAVLAYAAGLAAFGALRIDVWLRGPEEERFGARWLLGGLMTAVCALLGWNGVFSAVYCAWGVIAALLPVQRNGRAWLCALLTTLQAVCGYASGCGWLNGWLAAGVAVALLIVMIFVQKRALYAAWLPVRAWFIRRRAKG